MKKPSLLIADDEEIIRKRVSLMLGSSFEIHEVATARETIETMSRGFDVILLDIMFPDGNGIDICKAIKQADPHSTVVMNSSMETVEAWNQAFEAGADGYFQKRELLNTDPRKICLMMNSLVERNRLRKHTEEINRKQTKLLSVLSHDIRAPFQALLGTMQMLKKSDIPPGLLENVDRMFEAANQQLAFINSLLELLRLDSGVTQLRLSPIDINLPVNQSVQTMRGFAIAKNQEIRVDLKSGLPKISGDIGQIARIMNNLISNSVKFTNKGGTIKITTSESPRKGVAGVLVEVVDEGIGISAEDSKKLFSPFNRGREKGTNGEVGSGLGLSICKELMDLHNGAIELESVQGKGSAFKLWFPSIDTETGTSA